MRAIFPTRELLTAKESDRSKWSNWANEWMDIWDTIFHVDAWENAWMVLFACMAKHDRQGIAKTGISFFCFLNSKFAEDDQSREWRVFLNRIYSLSLPWSCLSSSAIVERPRLIAITCQDSVAIESHLSQRENKHFMVKYCAQIGPVSWLNGKLKGRIFC